MGYNYPPEFERIQKLHERAEAALIAISGQFEKGACHDDVCQAALDDYDAFSRTVEQSNNGDPDRLEDFIKWAAAQALAKYTAHGGDYRPTVKDPAGTTPDKEYESKAIAFIGALVSTGRKGIRDLVLWLLEKTDFFTAPASAKYHSSYCGGLLDHSVNVFMRLNDTYFTEIERNGKTLSEGERKMVNDSIAISALLHDICKADFYKWDSRNVKDPKTGQWKKVPWISYDEKLPFGSHGDKSVFLAERYIRLTMPEAFAIRFHMGEYSTDKNTSAAFTRYPLAFLLHRADETATYIDENLLLQGISDDGGNV